MAVVRLYNQGSHNAGQAGKWKFSKLQGVLCYIVDRKARTRQLRLYDINTQELIFMLETYINFHEYYKELNDNFHAFPLEKIIMGVEFASVYDASTFKKFVNNYSLKGSNQDVIDSERLKMGKTNYTKPFSFERKEHAGWNPNSQTFQLDQVPHEIKNLLKKAGFKKKHLKSKDMALAIYEILLRDIDLDNTA